MNISPTLLLTIGLIAVTSAQYDSPLPPRLAIPGAAPVGGRAIPGAAPIGSRRGPLPAPAPGPARRIGGRGRPAPALRGRAQPPPLPPRPVIEVEDDAPSPTTFTPPTYQPTTFQPPAFRPNPPADLPVPTRQQYRGPPTEEAVFSRGPRPTIQPQDEQQYSQEEELRQEVEDQTLRPRPTPSEDQGFTRPRPVAQEEQGFTRSRPAPQDEPIYQRPNRPTIAQPAEQPSFQRARPAQQDFRPRPQVLEEQNFVRGRTEVKVPFANNRAQLQARPKTTPQPQTQDVSSRRRKPTAQVISKYRNDNPDGSITWGFENDDGTFKEETIGTDCITHGKYGYIDPDGVRREYTYSSGIPCDKANTDSEAGATNEGYIDYSNNKYVLPNGQEINLDNMVKNRARRPSYRN